MWLFACGRLPRPPCLPSLGSSGGLCPVCFSPLRGTGPGWAFETAAGVESAGLGLARPLTTGCSPIAEPKVVFAKEQAAHSEVKTEAGASATLSCKVAQAQTQVAWCKDGKKLSSSSRVHVEAAGCTRRLVVQQAGTADAREYSCEAGGQRVSFRLDVAGGCMVRVVGRDHWGAR
ncbi:obscurin-like [Ochotona curzoniae]|uniref:obscurin-like n=1 Tax=Ochotona curzoniae TaxID=130825 RepID=UPI001B347729|nr:obscurin-like [Ochotona curzoniae]